MIYRRDKGQGPIKEGYKNSRKQGGNYQGCNVLQGISSVGGKAYLRRNKGRSPSLKTTVYQNSSIFPPILRRWRTGSLKTTV